MLLQGGLWASGRGGPGPPPLSPQDRAAFGWVPRGFPFPLVGLAVRVSCYPGTDQQCLVSMNLGKRGGVGSGGLFHPHFRRWKPSTSLGHTSALRLGGESGPLSSSQSRVTLGESLGCSNPSLHVGVLLPNSSGWKGLTQLFAQAPSKHAPRGRQEEGTLGRDAQTLSAKRYARNSVPLVLVSRKMWPRCRVNSWAGGLRLELRSRQHQRGCRTAIAACLASVSAQRFTGSEPEPRAQPTEAGEGLFPRPLLAAGLSGPGDSTHTSPQTKQSPLTERLQEMRASDQALQACGVWFAISTSGLGTVSVPVFGGPETVSGSLPQGRGQQRCDSFWWK